MGMPQDPGDGVNRAAGRARQHRRAECSSAPVRPESTAAYIADITIELARLARGSQLEVLAYLLDIAQLEAASTLRRLAREPRAR
ncbi:hypothetical protein [Enterovirga aerilata]|uniref:Uncharacterized protein n=1 Tax=Enterovirga aerilata TaxID=2730920 RepID=A0A849IB93_9HYPH|nr:hypothetical protein [Enterovirga sp. DB1703]NNM73310.1 hypothetical protein [Enterovirga sp. DB1703]